VLTTVGEGMDNPPHPPDSRTGTWNFFFLVILVSGVGLRLWHMNWGLPHLYEEAMPVKISWKIWTSGAGSFDFNPHFFVYPAFTIYLQLALHAIQFAVGYIVGSYPNLAAFNDAYNRDPSTLILIARSVSVLFDACTIVVVYLLALSCADRRTAILAALLVAINPLHIREAQLINVDTPLTLFSVLSIFCAYKLYCTSDKKWYLLAGMFVGLAAATKYNGGLLVLVVVAAHLLKSHPFAQAARSLTNRFFLRSIAVSVVVFFLFNPYILLSFKEFSAEFANVEAHMEVGHLGSDLSTTTSGYYFLQSLPGILGWPLILIAFVAVAYLVVKGNRSHYVLLAFPVVFIATISSWAMRADRYIFPAVPMLILFGSIGLFKLSDSLIAFLKSRLKMRSSAQGFCIVGFSIALCTLVSILPLLGTLRYHRSISLSDTRTITGDWIDIHFSRGAAVASGPFGIEILPKKYLLLPIPFNAVNTQRTVPFYDTQWYQDVDLLITSDYDYSRYAREPERLHDILRFYDSVRTHWRLVFELKPGDTLSGPTFRLYQPPASSPNRFDFTGIRESESIGDTGEIVNFEGKLAAILAGKGKFEKSEQLLREVLRYEPRNMYLLRKLISLEDKLQKLDEAVKFEDAFLQLSPLNVQMLCVRGHDLVRLGRYDEAEKDLQQGLGIDEKQEEPYFDLVIIYAARKDKAKACETLSRCLRILPPNSAKWNRVNELLQKWKSSL